MRLVKAFYAVWLIAAGLASMVFGQESSILVRLEQDLKQLIEKVKPSVVTVSAHRPATLTMNEESFFSISATPNASFIDVINIGSGIVLDSIHILTHSGIVLQSDSIEIIFYNGRHARGKVIGVDHETGLAVLQTRYPFLKAATVRTHEPLAAGCTVALVGNSLGISSAISLGIVNGIHEDGMIQISTSVAAGNAGSPLFDNQGRLAGILAGRVSPIGEDYVLNEGLSLNAAALAFPAAFVIQRVRQIMYSPALEQGWIGVSAEDWPGGMGWVHISDVKQSSPAHAAGLKIGDIVFSTDKRAIQGSQMLAQLIRKCKPGQKIQFGVLRGDSTFSVSLDVGADPVMAGDGATLSYSGANARSVTPASSARRKTIQKEMILQRINSLEQELGELRSMLKK